MTQDKAREFRLAVTKAVLGGAGVIVLAYVCERLGLDVATTAMVLLIAVVLLSLTGSFAASAIISAVAALSLHLFFRATGTPGHRGPAGPRRPEAFLFRAGRHRLLSRGRPLGRWIVPRRPP